MFKIDPLLRRPFRTIRQSEVAECGLACLAMVAFHHGLKVDMDVLRRRFDTSTRGTTLKSIIASANELKLEATAMRVSLDQLQRLRLPAILHWDLHHFVVLERAKGGRYRIHDPARGPVLLDEEDISRHFSGVVLELVPTLAFERADLRRRVRLRDLWQRMVGLKRSLAQALLLSAMLQFVGVLSPYFIQIVIDQVLPADDWSLLNVLALAFGSLVVVSAGLELMRSLLFLNTGMTVSYGIGLNVARKLFQLPTGWFARRHVGDVVSRLQAVGPIQQSLTQGPVSTIADGLLAAVLVIVMLFYSVSLTLLAVLALLLTLTIRLAAFGADREARAASIEATAAEQSSLIESVRGMTTIRIFGKEDSRQAAWRARFLRSIDGSIRQTKVTILSGVATNAVIALELVLAIWISARLILNGEMTTGMMVAYLAYQTQFLAKAGALLDQALSFRMVNLYLERLSDIVLEPRDAMLDAPPGDGRIIEGRVQLQDVWFSYDTTQEPLLRGIDLTIEPGEHVAVTGPSGGGKSTLARLVLGLDQPTSGVIMVDGRPLLSAGYAKVRAATAAVLQNDCLFAGSIIDNIAFFDEEVDRDRVEAAAKSAALLEDLEKMPMGLNTLVGDMGSALSGGQMQRVLIARALYRQPRILVIDEGTSHLDPEREKLVNEAISKLGITRISIAHRAETIASADRVLSLANGRLAEERGPLPRSVAPPEPYRLARASTTKLLGVQE